MMGKNGRGDILRKVEEREQKIIDDVKERVGENGLRRRSEENSEREKQVKGPATA